MIQVKDKFPYKMNSFLIPSIFYQCIFYYLDLIFGWHTINEQSIDPEYMTFIYEDLDSICKNGRNISMQLAINLR